MKLGEEYMLIIPRDLAWRVGLEEDTTILIEEEKGRLVIEIPKPKYRLEDLLAKVSEENIHEETDTGEPVGVEIW